MKIENTHTDETILEELGSRLARSRLNKNLTQASLASEAGVSLSTINRLESGQSVQLSNLIRVLRALRLLDNLEALLPDITASPLQLLKLQGKTRKRASGKKLKTSEEADNKGAWTWDLPGDRE